MSGEIFISYRRSDQAKAALLYDLLKARGVDAWYDALLGAGEDWRTTTAGALEKAPIFVLLFSQAASESTDIAKELAAATLEKKLVVPVRIENIRPKGAFLYELASRNWVDAYENTEEKFAKLADDLAALVKGGPKAEQAAAVLGAPTGVLASAKASTPLTKRPLMIVGAAALAALVVAALFLLMPKGGASGGNPANVRVALFGFSSTGDDPVQSGVASTATEEAFRTLTAMRIGVGSRPEPAPASDTAMASQATKLGARFGLTGEVRREGDTIKTTARLIDARTGDVIGEQRRDYPVAQQVLASYAFGGQAASMSICVLSAIASFGAATPDADAITLIGNVCTSGIPDSWNAMRELVRRNPENGVFQAGLSSSLVYGAHVAPQGMGPGLIEEARSALAVAERVAPHAYLTAAARMMLAISDGKPPVEWLPVFEADVRRTPRDDERFWYPGAANAAGSAMLLLGRNAEAASYFDIARRGDPTANFSQFYYAIARASSGQYGASAVIAESIDRRVNGDTWETALVAAIFLDAVDPELIFPLADATNEEAVGCYRDIWKGLKSADRRLKLDVAKRADACLTTFDSAHINIMAQAALGNVDRAFDIASRPDLTLFLYRYFPTLFLPPTRPMRADARFLPLMERLGYVDYWKQTKTQPDICKTSEERDIPLCVALREAG